jgi:hypothetical protein
VNITTPNYANVIPSSPSPPANPYLNTTKLYFDTSVCQGVITDTTAAYAIVDLLRRFVELFIPRRSEILWGAIWVISVVFWNQYVQYMSMTFFWFDTAIAAALGALWARLPVANTGYCQEGQLVTSFHATLLTHALCCGMVPLPIVTSTICGCGLVVSWLYLLMTDATCSVHSLILASLIGSIVGVVRVLFYYDVILPLPRAHILSDISC